MFQLKESSSGKLLNHVWGTSIENAHFGIPKMCTFTWCTSYMVQ